MMQKNGQSEITIYDEKKLNRMEGHHTERDMLDKEGRKTEVTRLISARQATNFERGLYYGKYD